MKCEAFHDRLNDCLDDRRQPSGDRQLRQHAAECRDCRSELQAWQCISQSLERTPRPKRRAWAVALPIALAASLAFLLLGARRANGPDQRQIVKRQPAAVPAESREVAALPQIHAPEIHAPEIHAPEIHAPGMDVPGNAVQWKDVAWIDRWSDRVAEPLEPLSHGFAPLGRSFQTAVTLLVLPREIAEAESPPPFAQPLQSETRVLGLDVNYA